MAAEKRTKKSKSSSLTVEMIEYFGGRHRATPRELIPFTFRALSDSLAAAMDALLAPFPDLADWPKTADEARHVIEKCVKWAASPALAFNADPNCGQPYGLQTHFSMQPGGRWAVISSGHCLPKHDSSSRPILIDNIWSPVAASRIL